MCGVFGFSFENKKLLSLGAKMLSCRSKDGVGSFFLNGVSIYHAGLRLTDLNLDIIQPLEKDNMIISFVGEIYNKDYLVNEFCRSYGFISEGEMIKEMFILFGKKFISFLNGEFIIHIYDKGNDKHYFFRDRYGTKCLYYSIIGKHVFFSSEIKALYSIGIPSCINKKTIEEYMTFGFSISPNTIFKDISLLQPGTLLEFSKGVAKIDFFDAYTPQEKNFNFLDAFEKSIIRRIPKDHAAIFLSLSGGLDSTLILHFLLKHYAGKIIAYSFKNKENTQDIIYAKENATFFNVEHHVIDIEDGIFEKCNAPLRHEGLVKLMDFSKIVRLALPQYSDVHIEFSGDGREEIFQTNTHFIESGIKKRANLFGLKYDINSSFLNRNMLDYNFQLIEKITLNHLIERRLPFTDYEIIKFIDGFDYKNELTNFLHNHGYKLVPKTYGHNNAINFSYLQTKQEVIFHLKTLLKGMSQYRTCLK